MKRIIIGILGTLIIAGSALAAGVDKNAFTQWAKGASVAGYTFGGVEETDPGVLMAVWTNAKEEMVGVQLQPAAEFKKTAGQTINKKKPIAFAYKDKQAVYTDALAPSGSISVSYEASGKTLVLMNMGQPRAMTKDELVKILDGMNTDKLLK